MMKCPYCDSVNTEDENLDEDEYEMTYLYYCKDCDERFYAIFHFTHYMDEEGMRI